MSGKKREKPLKVEKKQRCFKWEEVLWQCLGGPGNYQNSEISERDESSWDETSDAHTGNNLKKYGKAKQNKRKKSAEAHSLDDAVNEEPVT